MEKYLDWIIDEKNIATNIFGGESDGRVTLQANIYPNIESLYCFLLENRIVKVSYSEIVRSIKYNTNIDILLENEDFKKSYLVIGLILEFAKPIKYSLKESSWAITSISMTGNKRTYNRTLNKIKEKIRQLPNIRSRLVLFLKQRGVINKNAIITCEILHKEL